MFLRKSLIPILSLSLFSLNAKASECNVNALLRTDQGIEFSKGLIQSIRSDAQKVLDQLNLQTTPQFFVYLRPVYGDLSFLGLKFENPSDLTGLNYTVDITLTNGTRVVNHQPLILLKADAHHHFNPTLNKSEAECVVQAITSRKSDRKLYNAKAGFPILANQLGVIESLDQAVVKAQMVYPLAD